MKTFLAGLVAGIVIGVFFGIYLSRFPEAVTATAIGLGAGAGIFLLGALVRYVASLTDTTFSEIKEGNQK